jgi:CCR4-NOT transcription complex subunit 3
MNVYGGGIMRDGQQLPATAMLRMAPASETYRPVAQGFKEASIQAKLANGQESKEQLRILSRTPSPSKEPRESREPVPHRASTLELLATSFDHKQQPQDAGRIAPTNAVPMEKRIVQFPTLPMQVPTELYGKFEEDTLFFIFYYQQGTLEQLLAAKELKRRNWLFNTKYCTWFQRYEPPKLVTKEKEEGAFIYFDFESGWCKKIKKEFTLVLQNIENDNIP